MNFGVVMRRSPPRAVRCWARGVREGRHRGLTDRGGACAVDGDQDPRAGAAMVPFAGLLAALEGIADPRRRQGRRYPLAPLLLFSVLAVLAGATSYRGILTFIGVHRERLNAVFGARFRRAPAVNTLRGLFLALDPAELEAAFREHARALADRKSVV